MSIIFQRQGLGDAITGGAGAYDPIVGVIGAAAAAQAAAAATQARNNPWSEVTGSAGAYNPRPQPGITGGIGPYEGSGNDTAGVFGTYDPLYGPIGPSIALIEAALAAIHAGQDPSGAARDLVKKSGGFIAQIALALGMGYAAATALIIAGVGIFGIILLKK